MKRIVSLVLALAMVLSLCIFTTASADNGFVDGKFTETRHITVEVYNRYNDGGSDPTSSVYAQYIKQGMLDKYNVDVELVSVGRWTEVDDLNNLLATGDAPDVCVTYSYPTIQTFAGMGGIIDLNPLLTEYKDMLPDLWALLGDYNIYYDQDPETGSVWAIEAVLAESARINTFIRKDWLDKLGLKLPTTEEEFHNCLIAFRDNADAIKSEFGIPVDANGNALCTGNQISTYGCPLLSCCQNRNIFVLCVHKKYVVKTVLMELRCKCQIIPPVVFISDDIGSHDFIYRPQAFIISQRYLTSFLYW
jgi:ABC-type glycerol-3-phosphate transport system substrate-binding protein